MRHVVVPVVAMVAHPVGLTTGAEVVVAGHRGGMTTAAWGGIVGIRGIASRDWSRAAVVVTTVTTATVSVDGMGSSVRAALGRRPVVASGMGWLRRGEVVDLLAGHVSPQ